MLILKYSYLGQNLLKTINPKTGRYGAVNAETQEVVIEAQYDYLFNFEKDRAVALKNGIYLEVDQLGFEFYNHITYDINPLAMKADYCPTCHGTDKKFCETCKGWGVIGLNYDFHCD